MSVQDMPGAEVSRRRMSEKSSDDGWDEPEPLDPVIVPPQFPIDCLPRFIADYCLGLAGQLQTPVDMPAMACLGVLATAAGGRVEVEARPGWREPTNLYLISFSDPASRKTPAVKAPTVPLRRAEKRLRAVVKPRHVKASTEFDIADKFAKKLVEATAGAKKDEDRQELQQRAVEARQRADLIDIPPLPTLLSEDSTPEALTALMADNHGRSAIIAAETDALDTLVGRYAKTSNLGILLKAHSGEPHRENRRTRGLVDLDRMNLTLCLMGQPAVLAKMVANAEWAGRGVLARLLISVPVETVGYRTPGTAPVDAEIAAEYSRRIENLALELAGLKVTGGAFGLTETLVEEGDEPQLLSLSPEADDLLLTIEMEIEPELREDGDLGEITGWGGKLAGAVVRIAGLLHVAEHPVTEPVSVETLERAWEIGKYFRDHALIAFRQVGITGATDAHKVLDYLRREKPKEFTIRDLHSALKGSRRFREAVAVLAAVEVLEKRNWVIRKYAADKTGPGRKPSPTFESHPQILE